MQNQLLESVTSLYIQYMKLLYCYGDPFIKDALINSRSIIYMYLQCILNAK